MSDNFLNDYQELLGGDAFGGEKKAPVAPEDEFFHSIYISGADRTNHAGIEELTGKMQIRGVDYNQTEVYMVITKVKRVLMKAVQSQNGGERAECFSYMDTKPCHGYNGRVCGESAAERAADPFCNSCKMRIKVAGIRTNAQGQPIKKDNKPIFMFIDGKGIKVGPVFDYLNELSTTDFSSKIFEGDDDQSKELDQLAKLSRVVTKVTIGKVKSAHGDKKVFNFSKHMELKKDSVLTVLRIAKNSLEAFDEKFNWSKNQSSGSYGQRASTNEVAQAQTQPSQQSPSNSDKNEFEDLPF